MAQDTGGIYLCLVKYLQAHEGSNRYTSIAHPLCSLSLPLLTYPRSSKILSFFNSFQNLRHINGLYSPGNTDPQTYPQRTEKMYQAKVKTIWTGKGCSCLLRVSWVALGMSPNLHVHRLPMAFCFIFPFYNLIQV